MFQNKRPFFLIASLFLLFLWSLPQIYGYWGGVLDPDRKRLREEAILIGRWYFNDPKDTDAPEVIIFDPKNPPKETIESGTVIIYQNPDGTTTLYTARVNINPKDPDFDPTKPNKDFLRPMKYAEDTKEYRSFHHYRRQDYTWHKGKLYQWLPLTGHNPNTVTQIEPGTNPSYWKEIDPKTQPENLWFRHVVYMAGEKVSYQGKIYEAILGGRSGFIPSSSVRVWKEE
ncbi:MAG: hypothetical protein Q4E37_04825 [Tissierellia bacterium]|nr:hypothetical protein [Tissierellia bacterium]